MIGRIHLHQGAEQAVATRCRLDPGFGFAAQQRHRAITAAKQLDLLADGLNVCVTRDDPEWVEAARAGAGRQPG